MIPRFRVWEDGRMRSFEEIKEEFVFSYFENEDIVFMQSSGLKDMDGVEIYEGDIVEFKDLYDKRCKNIGCIVYREDKACFGIRNQISTEEYELYRVTAEHYLKVAGNVFENEELFAKCIH